MSESEILMAIVGAAHGIRGEVRVKTFTADPLALGDYGPLRARDGRRFTVRAIRPAKDVVVVRFAEIADRNAAEALSGLELFVDRAALPDDLGEEEFYHADLVGLEVRDEVGHAIGRVTAVHDFGAGDILDIALKIGTTAMVPFTKAAVPEVRLSDGYVRIDSQVAGLTSDEGGDEGA